LTGGVTIEPVKDLASARSEWNQLAVRTANVFSTWEWADAWYQHLAVVSELAVSVVRRADGEPIAILPMCLSRTRPVRLLRFIGAGPSDQLGPVCAFEDQPAVADALRRHVSCVLSGSGIFLAERLWSENHFSELIDGTAVRHSSSPVLPIRGRTFDEFLSTRSRNFREQVRRRERRLMREHRVVYRLTEDPARVEGDMQTLMRLHAARWTDGRSEALSGPRAAFHLDFAARALKNGWLRLWTLELDDRPVAAWYGLRYAGTELYYQAGRDPAYEKLNVGFVLLCHTIRSAFDDGLREYRFGHGNEPYKSRFAEHDPGLDTVAVAHGVTGRIALAALLTALRFPHGARGLVLRVGQPIRT
jgi:CelD/BcsL family acetyltransferase involved in cellulose biosynthesis